MLKIMLLWFRGGIGLVPPIDVFHFGKLHGIVLFLNPIIGLKKNL